MALFQSEIFHVICITFCSSYFRVKVTSAWIICMSHLHCSVGQQVRITINLGSDTRFEMRIYEVVKVVSYTKLTCYYSNDSQIIDIFLDFSYGFTIECTHSISPYEMCSKLRFLIGQKPNSFKLLGAYPQTTCFKDPLLH